MSGSQYVVLRRDACCHDLANNRTVDERAEDELSGVFDNLMDPLIASKRRVQQLEDRLGKREARNIDLADKLDALKTDLLQVSHSRAHDRSRIAQLERDRELRAHDAARLAQFEKEKELEEVRFAYRMWKKTCDRYFALKKRTTFAETPEPVEVCKDRGCASRRQELDSIGTCKHDVESILRGSGQYNIAFLRKERLRWHPDKFARSCDPSARQELAAKATQMYAIMEELIAEENTRTACGGCSTTL